MIYNSNVYKSIQIKDLVSKYEIKNKEILSLKEKILQNGYDGKVHLFLRSLYLPNDAEGSYYIDNGLHRSLALALLFFSDGEEYFPVPAVLAFKSKLIG